MSLMGPPWRRPSAHCRSRLEEPSLRHPSYGRSPTVDGISMRLMSRLVLGISGLPASPGTAESGQLGYRQEYGGIFQRLKAVAVIGHDQHVAASGIPGHAPCRESYATMQDQHRRLARILVLGKLSARDHADEGLAHHLLMTAKDSVRGMSTTRGSGQLHLLPCESLERDLLHANSVPARTMPRSRLLGNEGPITVTVELPRDGKSLALTANCHVKAA